MTNNGVFGPATPASLGAGITDLSTATYGSQPVYDPATSRYRLQRGPKYNPARSTYNLTASSLARFRAQVGKALTSTSVASIACLGDSITEGVTSTPHRLYNWPNYLRSLLNADGRLGVVGEGAAFNTGQATGGSKTAYDERWTLGTGWTWSSGGLANNSMAQATGGGTLSFVLPSCDTVTIYYMRHSIGGTWSWNIDGGTATNVNSNGSLALQSTTFSAGSVGTHTLNIVSPASNYAFIVGVAWSTSGAPFDVNVITGGAQIGITTSKLTDETNTGYGTPEVIDLIQPDLTIVLLGRNDSNPANGVSPGTYYANMETFIKRCRVTNSKDVLLVTPPPASLSAYPNDGLIMQALYKLADTYDCALIDLQDRFGPSWNVAPYSVSADNIHPNDAGMRVLAQAVAGVILDATA